MTKEQYLKAFQRVIDSEYYPVVKESLEEEAAFIAALTEEEFQEKYKGDWEDA